MLRPSRRLLCGRPQQREAEDEDEEEERKVEEEEEVTHNATVNELVIIMRVCLS